MTVIPSSLSRMTGNGPVASHLKVLSTYFYRYTRCVTGTNQIVSGRAREDAGGQPEESSWADRSPGGRVRLSSAGMARGPKPSKSKGSQAKDVGRASARRVQRMLPVWPSE